MVSSSATTSHTYASSGSYMASVTETDTAGTVDHRGVHRPHRQPNGGAGATASATVQIQVTDCSTTSNCTSGPVGVAATATTPAQTVTVTAPSSSLPGQTLTVANSPGLLECGGQGVPGGGQHHLLQRQLPAHRQRHPDRRDPERLGSSQA